jgi:hypothetical protein
VVPPWSGLVLIEEAVLTVRLLDLLGGGCKNMFSDILMITDIINKLILNPLYS